MEKHGEFFSRGMLSQRMLNGMDCSRFQQIKLSVSESLA